MLRRNVTGAVGGQEMASLLAVDVMNLLVSLHTIDSKRRPATHGCLRICC